MLDLISFVTAILSALFSSVLAPFYKFLSTHGAGTAVCKRLELLTQPGKKGDFNVNIGTSVPELN